MRSFCYPIKTESRRRECKNSIRLVIDQKARKIYFRLTVDRRSWNHRKKNLRRLATVILTIFFSSTTRSSEPKIDLVKLSQKTRIISLISALAMLT